MISEHAYANLLLLQVDKLTWTKAGIVDICGKLFLFCMALFSQQTFMQVINLVDF